MPLALFSIAVQLLFLPLVYLTTVLTVVSGDWRGVALFGAVLTGVQLVLSAVAVVSARERWWHLLLVPLYRIIYEPLRFYLLYAAMFQVLSGRAQGWYKPKRTGTVDHRGSTAHAPRLRTRPAEQRPVPHSRPDGEPLPVVA